MPRRKRLTQEAANAVCDTLRYAKKRGYSLDMWLFPEDEATIIVSRPISHESTPVASGCYDDMVRFVEYWREIVVSRQIEFSDPVRVTVACFIRDQKIKTRRKPKPKYSDDDLDREALEIWSHKEQPNYYSVQATERRIA